MLKILIADDHYTVQVGIETIIRDTLIQPLEIEFAFNGKEVLDLLQNGRFDMMILDINMPGVPGLNILKSALKVQKDIRILVLSVSPEEYYAVKCLQSGAYGYLSKTAKDDELKKAINEIAGGSVYITEYQKQLSLNAIIKQNNSDNPFNNLSEREFEVLRLVLKGYGALEIANVLDINPSTASTYKARLFKKTGVNTHLQLFKLAQDYGITDDGSLQL